MAEPLSDYTNGTASVSGTTVTGVGTAWQAAEFQAGDIFIAAGWWAIVASVVSNTQLTLTAWAGPNPLSASPYRLRYQSSNSRVSGQTRNLIDLLGGSGNVEAFSALTGSANGVPVFTGPGTMEIRTFPASGVTSVGLVVPTGFSASGSPVTSAGNITLSYSAGYQGFQTAQSTKLAGIATGATANQTDAYLLNRTNHTGAQAISTVTNLQTTLNDKASLTTENQSLSGGATVTSKSLGTVTSGTLTLDMGDCPMQHYIANGAHTLAPGSVRGMCSLDVTNGASAGNRTLSGWTRVEGSFTNTNNHRFRCHCSVGEVGSLLIIQAMQ